MSNLTRIEKETLINWNEEEDFITIETSSKKEKTKLDKLVKETEDYTLILEDEYRKVYRCTKGLISFRKPRKLSEEKRLEMSERAKKNFSK